MPKNKHFSLDLKRSEAINQYFHAKNQSIVSKKRLKTEETPRRSNQSRTSITANLDEFRMKPLEKYFYKMITEVLIKHRKTL